MKINLSYEKAKIEAKFVSLTSRLDDGTNRFYFGVILITFVQIVIIY